MKAGRTIGERRERLESSSERASYHKKKKRAERSRIILTVLGFAVVAALIVAAAGSLFPEEEGITPAPTALPYEPTVEIIDEDAIAGSHISSRMRDYIGQAESDFRELGYTPVKAVIPTGAIREVDFYLDGYDGCIKLLLDRGTGVSVEDADRMLRYLENEDVDSFEYIDVRIDGKAYWR